METQPLAYSAPPLTKRLRLGQPSATSRFFAAEKRGNWGVVLSACEYAFRDISVSQHKDFIKYVEMELFASPRMVTAWSLPIPVTSWDDWSRDCTATMGDFRVDNPIHDEEEAKEATLSLGDLSVGYPIFSLDDDVVYLSARAAGRGTRYRWEHLMLLANLKLLQLTQMVALRDAMKLLVGVMYDAAKSRSLACLL
ncbi:hypothetical protein EJB05_54514, partial [Eragrostis curvula]